MRSFFVINHWLEPVLILVLIRKLSIARHLYREDRLSGKQIVFGMMILWKKIELNRKFIKKEKVRWLHAG